MLTGLNGLRRWSVPHIALTWVLGIVFGWRLLVFALSTRKLIEMKAFYEHLLDVPNVGHGHRDTFDEPRLTYFARLAERYPDYTLVRSGQEDRADPQ